MPRKINSRCEFEPVLDMNVVCESEEWSRDNVYELHSILVHSGSINSGHYYGFMRPKEDGRWFKFNDDLVTEIEPDIAFKIAMGGYSSQY